MPPSFAVPSSGVGVSPVCTSPVDLPPPSPPPSTAPVQSTPQGGAEPPPVVFPTTSGEDVASLRRQIGRLQAEVSASVFVIDKLRAECDWLRKQVTVACQVLCGRRFLVEQLNGAGCRYKGGG